MAAEVPVSDVLCEAMEYLSKLGSNLRTRSENLKEKRISKAKLKNSHAVQKAANKVLLICELSKKSLDNVETGVRNVLSILKASQAPISGTNSHKKNQGSNHRYHYVEYQSRKLRISKKISLKHYTSVKVLAKEMPASKLEKYPVYYDCKLKRLRCKVSTKHKSTPETSNFSQNDQCSEKSICRDVRELSSDDDVPVETTSKDLDNSCRENISDNGQSSPKPMVENQDSQCDIEYESKRESRDNLVKQYENKSRNEKQSESDSDVSSHQEQLTRNSEEMLNCDLLEDHKNFKNELSNKSRHNKPKSHSESDHQSNTSKKCNKVRFADVYSSDSNEEPKLSELNFSEQKGTINSPDVKNNNDDNVECVSDNSNNEPKAKKMKLTTSKNSISQLDASGANESKTDKEISDHNLANKELDNGLPLSEHCEGGEPSSDGESKPLIRCVNLSKLLKPGILGDNSKFNNVQHTKEKESPTNKKEKHISEKDKHHKKHELSEEENDKFWAQKRKEVREFKPKKVTVNIVRLANLSLNFLQENNLKKITRQGKIICEVQNEIDTPNSKHIKAVKNALLNDSESDECAEMPDTMQVKKSLLKDSDSEHNASDKEEQSKQPDKEHETNIEEASKDAESVENRLSDNFETNPTEADREMNSSKESTIAENIYSEIGNTDEKLKDDCVQTPGEDAVTDVEGDFQANDNNTELPNTINQAVKSSLLNDSSDEEFNGFSNNEQCNISKPNKSNENNEENQNNSGNEECDVQSNEKTPSPLAGIDETIISSLLNGSPDDSFAEISKLDTETPTKTNEKIKSALLNDSSDDNQHKCKEDSPTKVNEKVKSSLLNDSSDFKSDESDDQRERQKTPKSKRKYARRRREVKKKIKYSSSSDSEQDKPKYESHRRKSYISSSSSSEDIKKKAKKKKPLKMDSDSNDTDKNKSIDQVDGAVDEQSNSSVDKVRK